MSALLQDVRYALRRLGRAPVFTLFAVAILTIGIGLNAAVFGIVDALLLRPSPFPEPERIVHIYQDSDEGTPTSTAFPAYRDMAAMTDVFAGVAATSSDDATWDTPDGPRAVAVEYATASYFPVLGLRTSRGRWFHAEHDVVGAEMVAVVSDRAWQTRFAADPGVVGRTIRLNNRPVTIVGVGPPDFNGEAGALITDFWLSISSVPVGGSFRVANLEQRESHWYQVKARLAPGVTVERARVALDALAAHFAEAYPDIDKGRRNTLFSYGDVRIHPQADGGILAAGVSVVAVAIIVLLLACGNLANLLLVRGLSRAPELAVREALGGDRSRVARPLLLEALLLSASGGALGLGVAVVVERALSALPLAPNGAAFDLRFDYRLAMFGMFAAIATGLLFGLVPALRSSKTDVATVLRDAGRKQSAGRGASLLRAGLVVFQIALSVVLVVATGLLARSLVNAERVDPGVDDERIAAIGTDLEQGGVAPPDAPAVAAEILERIAALPGVERVALTTRLLLQNGSSTTTVVEGYEPPAGTGSVELPIAFVSPSYFATMGIPLLAGRAFSAADRPDTSPVVIVNETAARVYWSGDATGRRIRRQTEPDRWREVVGVVGDVKVRELQEQPTPMIYYSTGQVPVGSFSVVARTTGDPAALLGSLSRALRDVRSTLPVTRLESLATHVAGALASARAAALVMGGFSLLALTLAALGIYAAVSFAVERRYQEIGIRVALGATAPRVLRMVLGESLVVTGLGIAIGLGLAAVAARGLEGMLFGVAPIDWGTYVVTATLLAAAGAVAALVPAHRATRANPTDVLRRE